MAKKFGGSIVRTSRSQSSELSALTEIKNSILVLDELRDLIPPLGGEEYEQLKTNIEKEGVREPLLLWERGEEYILVDGHNRYRCIEELGRDSVKWTVKMLSFNSIEEVREWMINNQLGRRNLTDIQRALLIERKYELIKTGKGGDRKSTNFNGQILPIDQKANAYQQLAEETGRSERTVKNDIALAKGIDKLADGLKGKVLSGEKKIPKGTLSAFGRSNMNDFDQFEQQVKERKKSPDKTKELALIKAELELSVKKMMKAGMTRGQVRKLISETCELVFDS
ncbi:ParB/RepB/Spo0J family partition protein [Aureibacter tunicatorum]|uniref:ParB-like chromosome segregation protein Spo0J n=1 Tax=Aureibacter tunicatorum TaxID=866807 RepID=A0AAE4BVN1_9BACT|nr:ParB N-terminal domain-containing protein [Aureibacter tunicatorum]MDR6242082.1 ParB-like chromosome segregation protein Spo0J [Aureibacter tunicatorum]BDD07565.1 hypothetical protein AUTU_50480 [Aureibacter tunicatorum]